MDQHMEKYKPQKQDWHPELNKMMRDSAKK
jgi:hypothetical protein